MSQHATHPGQDGDVILEVEDLVKSYSGKRVLHGVSLEVRRGEIFGFLGPNGAGKTTTLEIIEGLRDYDSGRISVLGFDHKRDIRKIRQRLGVSLQKTKYWDRLTVEETIRLFQSFYRRHLPTDQLVEMFELESKIKAPMKSLSGGQYQRVVLALALVNDPDLVLLDEPTVGLDPRARRRLWDVIRDLKKRHKTVILTTHYMDEAEALSDRVAIIHQGRIVDRGAPQELVRSLGADVSIRFSATGPVDLQALAGASWCHGARRVDDDDDTERGTYSFTSPNLEQGLAGLLDWARRSGVAVDDLETRVSTLDDVFLRYADEPEGAAESAVDTSNAA